MVTETPANDTAEHPSQKQTEVAVEPAKNGRSPVEDPAKDLAVDFVGGHGGNSAGGMQSQL